MKAPLISIIIPTYNRAQLIKKAIDSILRQTYTNWECLVVDDGSEDITMEILKEYKDSDSRIHFFIRNRLPKGAPTCRNIGLEHTRGDYVVYLDSDDYLLPFCLEQRVKKINESPAFDFYVFPMGEYKDGRILKKEILDSENYLINFLSANLPWSIMCPLWKKTLLLQLEGFTEGYPRFNDPELMIRALIQDKVQFIVFNDLDYDTVFVPSPKNNLKFNEKIFNSLLLFIPDIAGHLEEKEMLDYKKYLALYLHLWFRYFYVPLGKSDINQSIRLIGMFKKEGVITILKSTNFVLRLLLYSMSNLFLKRPINKLTDKSLYI